MGEGVIIEAHNANQDQGGSTSFGEIHHHPVTKPNKNGSSPGYLKVIIMFNWLLDAKLQYHISYLQIVNKLIKFTVFLESTFVPVGAKGVKPKTYSQLDQKSRFQFYPPLSSSMAVKC